MITTPDSSKGLHIDAELIAWVLDKTPTTKVEIISLKLPKKGKIENEFVMMCMTHSKLLWTIMSDCGAYGATYLKGEIHLYTGLSGRVIGLNLF